MVQELFRKTKLTFEQAATFYGLTPILIPQDQQSLDTLAGMLTETKADVLIAPAGALPLKELLHKYPGLKQVIWVVERTSRHMDWNEVPEGIGGKADIAVWHDIIDDRASGSSELPTEVPGGSPPNLVMVEEDSMSAFDSFEVVEFTQKVIPASPPYRFEAVTNDGYRTLLPPLALSSLPCRAIIV